MIFKIKELVETLNQALPPQRLSIDPISPWFSPFGPTAINVCLNGKAVKEPDFVEVWADSNVGWIRTEKNQIRVQTFKNGELSLRWDKGAKEILMKQLTEKRAEEKGS